MLRSICKVEFGRTKREFNSVTVSSMLAIRSVYGIFESEHSKLKNDMLG
jgi:hypothetical protein